MNNEQIETKSELTPGDFLLVQYGARTQVVRVIRVLRSGNIKIRRFSSGWVLANESRISPCKVIGPAPAADPRTAAARVAFAAFDASRAV